MRQKGFGDIGKRWRWLFWETLIIVLGVLIAFAVNDYWSDRQDRELEIQYLKRLHADIESVEKWLSDYIETPLAMKFDALEKILSNEFQDLLNQEHNFGYFMQYMYVRYAQYSSELAAEVQAQINELEG